MKATLKSFDGQDGDISTSVATTVKEMSDSLAIDASAWGTGWGVTAKASFSYSKSNTMKDDEVVLRAKHSINLG